MPSFDIVNKLDPQEVDNAVNNTRKEVENRYDFRGLNTEITYNRKDDTIQLVVADEMKLQAVKEMLTRNFAKRNISPKVLDFQQTEGTSHGHLKMQVNLKTGISRETAKQITKTVKNLKLKVQPSIQDDQVRVTGKKIDDLQAVIQNLKKKDFGIPLQFVNIKN